MCKVSIIVPIYNVEKYLPRCLDSLSGQTFCDFEAILVDDGSTDKSGEIADARAAADSRFRVIHKENGGLSSARNAGLDTARGRYIYFADSDDFVEPGLLERVVPLMDAGWDMVVFGVSQDYSTDTVLTSFKEKEFIQDQDEEIWATIRRYIRARFRYEVWNKVFRRDIIEEKGLRFADNREIFSEDIYFFLCYVPHITRIIRIPDVFYHYVFRYESIMAYNYNTLNIGRVSRLMLRLYEEYKRHEDCAYLVRRYTELFGMVLRDEYHRFRGHSSHMDPRELYRKEFSDPEVRDFFEKQMQEVSRNKKMVLKEMDLSYDRDLTFMLAVLGLPKPFGEITYQGIRLRRSLLHLLGKGE